ncbi:MAG: peptide ABC transporter substrate-binding protein [Roseiflexaceae bacterium]
MARRIRWQILIAVVSSTLVLALMSYLAITTAAIQRPVEGGEYAEGLLDTPEQLNPLVADAANDLAGADIQALIFDGLMRLGPTGLPEPALAQGWQVDETGTVYTFFLRDGVTWHDGTPVTIDDVLFTIQAIQGPAFTGNPSLGTVWRNVLVEKIDNRTILCRLSGPFAPFLEYATFPILPAHLLANLPPEQWSTSAFARQPIGSGPYQLVELTSERALLRANTSYYRGQPFIQSIELRFYPQAEAAIGDLARGTIQGLSYTSASSLRDFSLPQTITRRSAALDGYTILSFNLREAPLNDPALRRALALGLDRQALIDAVFGGQANLIDTPILPQWWLAAPDVGIPLPNPARAEALLDDLGYPRGEGGARSLNFTILTDNAAERVATAEEIARQWGSLGIEVQVEQLEPAPLQERLANHQFSLAIHAWQRLGGDPDIYELWHSEQAEQGRNYAGLNDPVIDELITTARVTTEQDQRAAAYAAFQRRWVELMPSIPLYQPLLFYTMTTELGGVTVDQPDPDSGGAPLLAGRESRFRDVIRWFLQSSREIQGDLR